MKQEIKERIELINKGIVPAGYKKTPVGICPVEWIETILGKICEINPKTERLKSTFQYIDLESIVNGKVVAIKMINKQNAPSRAQRVLSKNDIIYQLVRPYQKNNFLLKNINENQIVASTGYAQLRCKNPEFIYNLINTDYFCNQVLEKCTGTNYPAITSGELYKILVNIPINDTEKQKIAEILDCATRQVELQEQLVDKLKVQKKALMQKLLTPRPDWQKDKLEKLINEGLITLYRGKVISKEDIKKFPGNYPIYSSSVINNGEMGEYGKYMFDEELITWSIDGGGNFFYRNKHKFSVTNVCGYIKINTNYFNYKFLAEELIYLHSKLSFDYMLKAHPSVIKKIYTINYPNLKEQTKIAKLALNLDKQIELQQKLLEQYKLRQKALMQLLLTGIVRVCK